MSVLYAFIFSGTVCLLAEIILNHTKLTPGHITTLFSVFGSILAFFNIYDFFIKKCNMGAIVLISNFGNSLYNAGYDGFVKKGIIGLFSNMLTKSSLVITSTIIFSFFFVCLFRSKD
ncbi:MAG: SpoVA/SpoVAEb family sporulation membrane protein [Bacilli bacterium]|nr:SpoVA/SpoVAEb family sporulation membrane protein [Bacilli bacterium]